MLRQTGINNTNALSLSHTPTHIHRETGRLSDTGR